MATKVKKKEPEHEIMSCFTKEQILFLKEKGFLISNSKENAYILSTPERGSLSLEITSSDIGKVKRFSIHLRKDVRRYDTESEGYIGSTVAEIFKSFREVKKFFKDKDPKYLTTRFALL